MALLSAVDRIAQLFLFWGPLALVALVLGYVADAIGRVSNGLGRFVARGLNINPDEL